MNFYFFLVTIYYIFSRNRLLTDVKNRNYTNRLLVILDSVYFASMILYFGWVVFLFFTNFWLGATLSLLLVVRWFFLDPFNMRRDILYCIIKMCILCLIRG